MSVALDPGHYDQAFADAAPSSGPQWLRELRERGLAAFRAVGFPTTQHEDWRYTNLAGIAATPYVPAAAAEIGADVYRDVLFDDGNVDRLVFVNGIFSPEHSQRIGGEVLVRTFAAALADDLPGLRENLGRYTRLDGHPLAALATAFMRDGVVVHVPKGVVIERPIHVIHVNKAGAAPSLVAPRVLIVAEESSQATIVESYVGTGEGRHLTTGICEIIAGENAFIDHHRVQHETDATAHFALLRIQQARSSNVQSHLLNFGGELVRNEVNAVLAGDGGNCDLYGLFMPRGAQHMDNHLRVEHEAPHCDSREFFKGILDDQATGVFTGRIFVHRAAQKTDAKQSNMNLLLSPDARIDTKPQLEIFADDVKCTHGATIGQMDEEALLYLRTRGIGEVAARSLLVYAFAGETVEQVRNEALKKLLHENIVARLPQGDLLRELV